MRRGATRIRGVIRWDDHGDPVQNATVTMFAAGQTRPLGRGRTDQRGRYTVDVVRSIASGQPVYAVVRDRARRAVLSTRQTPVGVHGRRATAVFDVDSAYREGTRRAGAGRVVRVGPVLVNRRAVDRAEPSIALDLAGLLVDRLTLDRSTKRRIAALSPVLLRPRDVLQTCGDPVLRTIEHLIAVKGWPREILLEVDRMLSPAALGDVPSIHECPNFRITYYTTGPAAVSPDTSAQDVVEPGGTAVRTTLAAGPPPSYIKRLCYWLETALATYTNAPYALPNPAAAGRIPVEVTNAIRFGNATATIFYINNALRPDMLAAVVVHEVFHRVQYAYPGLDGSGPWAAAMKEGGATWAEDTVTDLVNRYLYEAGDTTFSGGPGLLAMPHKSLENYDDRYKTSLFWRYVAEQHSPLTAAADEPTIGAEVYRTLIETCSAGAWSAADVRQALRTLPWYQDFYEFGYLDPARLDLTSGETTWGNFAVAAYAKDLGANVPGRRFAFMDNAENIYFDDLLNTFFEPAVPAQARLAAVTIAGTGALTAAGSLSFSSSVPRFGRRYYVVTVASGVTSVRIEYAAGAALVSGLFQVILVDEDGAVRDIHRTDRGAYVKQVTNVRDGKRLDRIVLIASGAASAGPFSITVAPAPAASDVMVTRWNSALGTEHEIDSRSWSWTWVSPDVWVDSNMDGVADDTVFLDTDNKLFIRLRNKGNADASGIAVQFDYQDASGGLSPTAWRPVRNAAGVVQSLSGLTLAAGATSQWSVDWAPAPSAGSDHFCVRAVVTAPGDPNSDNKRVLSNFGNVAAPLRGMAAIRLLRRNLDLVRARRVEAMAVPRLGRDLALSLEDLGALNGETLKPAETVADVVRVEHRPLGGVTPRDDRGDSRHRPDPRGDYPTDPRSLPPGVAGRPMLTLVHMVDGMPQGGVTILVKLQEEPTKRVRA